MGESTENYIKEIYKLGGSSKVVPVKDIALALRVKAPSVTEMMKKLEKEGLIGIYPYKGITLTKEGEDLAKEILTVHRLWEIFLYEYLDIDETLIHEEACRLEHSTSDLVRDRLRAFLNNPEISPHGKKIY